MPEPIPQKFITIDFEPVGQRIEIELGDSLHKVAHIARVALVSVCCGNNLTRRWGIPSRQPDVENK